MVEQYLLILCHAQYRILTIQFRKWGKMRSSAVYYVKLGVEDFVVKYNYMKNREHY